MLNFQEPSPFSDNFNRNVLTPATEQALIQVASGTHHNLVPLADGETLAALQDQEQAASPLGIAAVAAFTIARTGPEDISQEPVIAPPPGMGAREYWEACLRLTEPITKKMMAGTDAYYGLVDSGTLVATGVMQCVSERRPGISFGALIVPKSHITVAPAHLDYPPELFATDLAAAMFDMFAKNELSQSN